VIPNLITLSWSEIQANKVTGEELYDRDADRGTGRETSSAPQTSSETGKVPLRPPTHSWRVFVSSAWSTAGLPKHFWYWSILGFEETRRIPRPTKRIYQNDVETTSVLIQQSKKDVTEHESSVIDINSLIYSKVYCESFGFANHNNNKIFPNVYWPPQNSRHQKGDIKQDKYRENLVRETSRTGFVRPFLNNIHRLLKAISYFA
jgi:hypothetical protein